MYSTAFLLRSAKFIFVFAIGVMALLIVIGNTTDYYTNYYFVAHVMKMDTIFPDSNIHYRSINNPIFFMLPIFCLLFWKQPWHSFV